MDSKITIKLNPKLVKDAKRYAKETNTSLSEIIENYLIAIVSKDSRKRKINPIVKSLTGIVSLNEDFEKSEYLRKKYK